MRWSRPKSRFPGDMLPRLELYGRFEMDPMGSGLDGGENGQLCVRFYEEAQREPAAFTADLRALVARDTGGFATYGASRLVWDLLSGFSTPDALALLDAAIDFKLTFGPAGAVLCGYEQERWRRRGPR